MRARERERDLANFLTSKSKGCDVDKFQAPVFPLEIMEGTIKMDICNTN